MNKSSTHNAPRWSIVMLSCACSLTSLAKKKETNESTDPVQFLTKNPNTTYRGLYLTCTKSNINLMLGIFSKSFLYCFVPSIGSSNATTSTCTQGGLQSKLLVLILLFFGEHEQSYSHPTCIRRFLMQTGWICTKNFRCISQSYINSQLRSNFG